MVRIYDIRQKEVINIRDGSRFGYVCDIEVDVKEGKIVSVIIPGPGRIFGVFGRDQEFKIKWCDIKQVGDDIILVDVDTEDALQDCE